MKTTLFSLLLFLVIFTAKAQFMTDFQKADGSVVSRSGYGTTAVGGADIKNPFKKDPPYKPSPYSKKGVSVVLNDPMNPNELTPKIIAGFNPLNAKWPEKYDYNEINTLTIKGIFSENEDLKNLIGNRVANDVMNSVFADDKAPTGWSFQKLVARIRASMSDDQLKLFNATMQKDATMSKPQWIGPYIQGNYIATVSIDNVSNMESEYDRIDAQNQKKNPGEKVIRKLKGYVGIVNMNLYQIIVDEDYLINKSWDDKAAREAATYKLKFVGSAASTSYAVEAINSETPVTSLLGNFFNTACVENLMDELESKVPELRSESKVSGTFPIKIKVGTQENLKLDKRYIIYEKTQNAKGEEDWVKQAVVRASKVTDNKAKEFQSDAGLKIDKKFVFMQEKSDWINLGLLQGGANVTDTIPTTGLTKKPLLVKVGRDKDGMQTPSHFHQIWGKGISEGMRAVQEPGIEFNFGLGYGSKGATVRLEYYLSEDLKLAWPASPLSGLLAYVDFNIGTHSFGSDKTITVSGNSKKYETDVYVIGLGGGISKEFYFARNFMIAPFVGVEFETLKFQDADLTKQFDEGKLQNSVTKKTYDASYGNAGLTFNLGARVGYSITPQIRLMASVGFSPINYDDNELFNTKDGYLKMDSNPIRADFGVQFEF